MTEPLSSKQKESYRDSTARLNIWEGSVRSGKTFISIIRFLKALRYGPPGNAMIVAVSRDAMQRNVLGELCGLIGAPVPTPKATQMSLFGRTIFLVGANDERAQRRIQGSTLAMSYVDELTLIPKGFFKMLLSRLSVEGAQLFATTNPDSPFHWLKEEFLSNTELDMKIFKFRIDDNPSLTQAYIDNLKREYQGLWYKRYIDGEWVLAEGTVYEFFDEEDHVVDFPSRRAEYYIVGIDYGTTNPTVFTLVGYDSRQSPHIKLEKEYYYSSRVEGRQKTDTEYAEDLINFIKGYNVTHIYLDPSAASFRTELNVQGVSNIYDADNDVINGIRFVSQLLANGDFKICKGCRNTIREMGTYVWDTKAVERGEDKPLKQNDHCFCAGTLVATITGQRLIETIKEGDLVKTRLGYKEVLRTFEHEDEVIKLNVLGKEIICTPTHKFWTLNGWKEAQDLIHSDMFCISYGDLCPSVSNLMEKTIEDIQTQADIATESIINVEDSSYIERYGNIITDQFHPDTVFITLITTQTITTLAISNVYHLMNTYPIIKKILQKSKESEAENTQTKYDHSLKSGTEVQKEESGTANTLKTLCLKTELKDILNACNVGTPTLHIKRLTANFVEIVVKANTGESFVLTMSNESANFALKNIKPTNIQSQNAAQSLVEEKIIGEQKVYNLHVKDKHEYFVSNILVHNCMDALRYPLFSHFSKRTGNTYTKEDIDKIYNKSMGNSNIPSVFQQPNIHNSFY